MGHTASLIAAGIIVIFLEISIPNRAAKPLEGAVAGIIIILGARIMYLPFRGQQRIHAHAHVHDGRAHTHLHFHAEENEHALIPRTDHSLSQHSHAARFTGWNPILVGTVHGLAGSAALTLLVLTEVVRGGSRLLGLAYLFVFGVGSIGGMMLMSVLLSLPLVFTTRRFDRVEAPMRFVVALSSIGFGFYYAWTLMA